MKLWKLSLLSLSLPFALNAEPSSDKTDQLHLNTFENAVAKARVAPKYPIKSAKNGEEGWVIMSYVVDDDGSVSNILVEDSSSRAFEQSAVKALKKWKFSPATLDGKPVQQCVNRVQLDFQLHNQGVDQSFMGDIESVFASINAQNLNAAEEKLTELKNAKKKDFNKKYFIALAEAEIAKVNGDKQAEFKFLQQAIYANKDRLTDSAKLSLYARTFLAAVNAGKYPESLTYYTSLSDLPNAQEMVQKLQPTHQQVVDFFASEKPYPVTIKVNERGNVSHSLTRNAFTLTGDLSDLSTLDIRCERKLSQFKIAKDVTWNIPQSWGKCHLVVHGDENAEFTIVELNQAKTEA